MKMKKQIVVLIFFLSIIFLIQSVYSFDFDNWATYSNNDKVVTITNWIGLGETIAEAELITPRYNLVMPGKDRRVMIFEINNFGDIYINALKDMEIKNMRNGIYEDKEFYYQYAVYGEVDATSMECEIDEFGKNNCHLIVVGKKQGIIDWKRLDTTSIPKGKLTIALVTDVNEGDYYDGIPILFGKKVSRWATWTSSMTVGLMSYYWLNDTRDDYSSVWNLTIGMGSPTFVSTGCLIGKCALIESGDNSH